MGLNSVTHSEESAGNQRETPALPKRQRPRQQQREKLSTPAPETGRPETSKEFAARIKRVVLHPPRAERQEGAGAQLTSPSTPSTKTATKSAEQADGTPPSPTPQDSSTPAQPAKHAERSEAQLLDHIASSQDGIHLEGALHNRYAEDAFFAPIVKNPHQYKNFRVSDGLVFLRERGRELLCIPHVLVNGHNAREIVISHAHSLLAHLGPKKTADLLCDHVWWKT
ncbi:hypothetical protein DICSQDRAFT_67393, partial [Dichomitus squalens LYAD-421 SS1]